MDAGLRLKPTRLLYVVIFEFHASPSASREELLNGRVVSSSAYQIKLIGSGYHVEGKRLVLNTLADIDRIKRRNTSSQKKVIIT